ncbi:MAG TPA: PilZ domain-containing protein [Planctomycetota bacterium]|nr:PilZ domain-containing protein [Planctomycetota bacterium]
MTRRIRIKDRREHPRYMVGLSMEVKRERSPAPGLEAGVFDGQCVDLSRTGARFRTRELFHPHEKLELTFFDAQGEAALRCEVEVIRSIRVPRQYEVGARLTRLIPVDKPEASADDTPEAASDSPA